MFNSMLDSIQPDSPRKEFTSQGRALLAGATPLLVGFLAGNMGDAAEIAGKALIDEDQRKLKEENRLIDYLRKRRVTRDKEGKEGRLYQVRGPEGELRYRTREKAVDQMAPFRRRSVEDTADIKRLGGYKIITDKLTDRKYEVFVGEAKPGEVRPETKRIEVRPSEGEYPKDWTPTKEALTTKLVRDYNKVFEKSSINTISLKKSFEGMGIGELGTKLGIMRLVKDIEQRLSDADRDYYTKPVSASFVSFRKMFSGLKREITGKERKSLVREAKALFKMAISYSEQFEASLGKRRLDQLEAAGVPRDYGRKRLGLTVQKDRMKDLDKEIAELEALERKK